MDCISSVGLSGIRARVSAVVLVKGMSLCIRVKGPPPPRVGRSCLSVVYPGKEGVLLVVVNLLSWIVAMCICCSCRSALSSIILLHMPLVLIWSMLRVLF